MTTDADSSSARILVVDDGVAQMKALCDTLRDHGYETVGFAAGKSALAALQDTNFDLLLTDLMMPDMNGIALLHAARQIDPNLIGIVMTGEGTIASAVEAMKVGALDYILKPFKLSFVLPVLSRALAVRRLRVENAKLERRLHERAAELEAANKELESFSYSVSHDLRAPLRSISGFSGTLVQEYSAQMPAEAQRLLGSVIRNAARMEQLIAALLRLSRLSREPLSRRVIKVSLLVREVVEELNMEQGARRIDVHIGALPDSVGDLALLRQVFVNLLSNAFKYTRDSDPAMVEVGGQSQEGQHIYFVRDNGAGFDMRYADKLFGVFQRLHKTEEFEGTGVGLSIVQRVIQRHGGRVWAEAEVGKGAAFHFSLPA